MNATHRFRALALLALLALLLTASTAVVDETEYGAISRFGAIVRILDTPGLHWKLPFDTLYKVPSGLLHFRPVQTEILSADKRNLVIDSLLVWRIVDPRRYLEALGGRDAAERQLSDLALAELGSTIGAYDFQALISTNGQTARFDAVQTRIAERVDARARAEYGIAVSDIWLRQANLPEQNRRYVFERMQAERGRIAMQHRSEGEREAARIIAEADRERTRIIAEANRDAALTKSAGDAEAMQIYADAYAKNPDFYRFQRTLQAYEKILDKKTTVFLPADAEALRGLRNLAPAALGNQR
ncbi:MAG: protease modulator HflC [Gammaproteobacteria bacterium]